jgi:DNA-binding response OmpR family regulator
MPGRPGPPLESPVVAGRPNTILVAEDEANIRALICATLRGEPVDVVQAQDGPSALALALETRPRLVFLDWRMPGCSGIEVLRALRRDARTEDTVVLMLTARCQAADREEARRAGADGLIGKPFSPTELLGAVREVFGAHGG